MATIHDTIIHQDCSTLSKYLKYWWVFVASLLPKTLAPNIITFMGGFVMLLSGSLAIISQEPWTLLFHSFAIFSFQTLDALDGIQARKLNASSKLGNYIDHTTDVITLQIMFQVLFQTLQLDTYYIILLTLFGNINIYLTHWETAETNILYFPDGFSITELQLQFICMHLITYFFPNIWNLMIYKFTLNNILVVIIIFCNINFVTLPLIKRVISKKSLNKLTSLIPLIVITGGLMLWSLTTHINYFDLVIYLNIPYTLLTSHLLLSYLRFSRNTYLSNKFIYLIVILLHMSDFFELYENTLIKLMVPTLLFATVTDYLMSIYWISSQLNVPIFTIKQT